MYQWTDGTYISHHGILGQKWGIRRYQNKDGTLTAAGRRRQIKDNEMEIKLAKRSLEIAKREYEPKKKIAKDAAKKYYDIAEKVNKEYSNKSEEQKYKDELAFENGTYKKTKLEKEFDKASEEYRKANWEASIAGGNVWNAERYLKTLTGATDASFLERAVEGKKFVRETMFNEKYYSEFWDENGRFIENKKKK